MITKDCYDKYYSLANGIVRFEDSLTNATSPNWQLYNYLKSLGQVSFISEFKKIIRTHLLSDLLNCYFSLGYHHEYNSDVFVLFDMVQYAFWYEKTYFSFEEFSKYSNFQSNTIYFEKGYTIVKRGLDSVRFPLLYIYLSESEKSKSEEYILILQKILISLSQNTYAINKELTSSFLTNPQSFLEDFYDDKVDELSNDQVITNNNNEGQNNYDMELLKDKLFNGISFEIIKEEYREGYSSPFALKLRVTNYNDHKKKIKLDIRYISIKHGLKERGYILNKYIPDNSFVDENVGFEDITQAYNGDRMELEVNEGKFASLRLVRERGQWWIVESIERSTYNRELKNKIEHFEAIEEQFGITLQNFSVKVEDENSLNLFCEVIALNGKVEKRHITIEVAIYDSYNDITYHTSLFSNDFKGFEVYHFGPIRLDITVDEISKIRIYPV